jgi:hypothetical protein
MLDPFSALSLASSIVQFVDFTSKLVIVSRDIRTTGGVTSHIDLEDISRDLKARVFDLVGKAAEQEDDVSLLIFDLNRTTLMAVGSQTAYYLLPQYRSRAPLVLEEFEVGPAKAEMAKFQTGIENHQE